MLPFLVLDISLIYLLITKDTELFELKINQEMR